MVEVTVSCDANWDGRRSVGVSVGRQDYFKWQFGAAPTAEDVDPRLEWTVQLSVPSDRPLADEAEVAFWYRCHRGPLAEVVREAAEQLPQGIAGGIAGWSGEFPRTWGRVRVSVSACDSFQARRVAESLREFADAGLSLTGPRPVAVRDAVAPTEWLALRSEV